ncbi:fibronectin type III domain-containing protein, partial [Flavobacterium sp. RHBU_24]|uniref:fibronectin type III domain-containing protein n=1 Tax=Flavobacterium sp. RHBU_24 TaxID=3391185 RepID=UPI003984F980
RTRYIQCVNTCAPPTAVVGTPTSSTTATLSWTAPATGTPTGYQYVLTVFATDPVAGTTLTTTTATTIPSYTLVPGVNYYLHVRS